MTADELRKKNSTDGKPDDVTGPPSHFLKLGIPIGDLPAIQAEADRQYRSAANLLSMILRESPEYREIVEGWSRDQIARTESLRELDR